ncbi:hypothetical protein [Arcticibacterium luteifluviistationis]|uniref:Uncharacterized protein n=1 Tax=Arcticibacterium luteifluviistationis TaxID=1784714 RepID=A0A2Z4GBP5_9BACT|nr:hypothetical protein [Arcticibacterium luteifluviistationis]AWV98480.1 hypothetical protein DJ013_09975 [Arcticibacterium luteifluviistationis]
MDNQKSTFIRNEVWALTIAGAFQRSNIYKKEATETQREVFKKELRASVDKLVKAYEAKAIKPEIHLQNIESVVQFFKKYDFINNEYSRFGIAQKVLNLYLKYLWVLNLVKVPPHFPVDRQIQYLLKIKESDIEPWTTMKESRKYMDIINLAQTKLEPIDNNCIASLELRLFNK